MFYWQEVGLWLLVWSWLRLSKEYRPLTPRLAVDDASTKANVLNFGRLLGAIIIAEGAEVEFRNLTLSNPGPQNLKGQTVNNVNYRSSNVGAWPSLIVLDGSTVRWEFATSTSQDRQQLSFR